jgi:hypothetical protein
MAIKTRLLNKRPNFQTTLSGNSDQEKVLPELSFEVSALSGGSGTNN